MISPPSSHRLSTWPRIVFGARFDEANSPMKGRKQTTSSSPGGRSFSHPIHERGQPATSRQELEAPDLADSAWAARFIVEVLPVARAMELITILNHCHRFAGFVYQQARFSADRKGIEVTVRPRRGSKATCSGCHQPAPGYDQLAERRFEFIPFRGFLVFLLYRMRRVDCRRCGIVVVEEAPWGDGKHHLTKSYMLFLASWARRLSWQETAAAFHTSCDKVRDAVEYVVTWGLAHRTLAPIRAIGVDEIQYSLRRSREVTHLRSFRVTHRKIGISRA